LLVRASEAISLIDTEALGSPRIVAAYLVTGKEKALVDMGYSSSYPTIIQDLKRAGIADDGLDYLLPTHVHLDHCGSCGRLADIFPSASVRTHPIGVPHLLDPTRLLNSAKQLFGDELIRKYGEPRPIENKRVLAIADDEMITMGRGLTLRSIWTPGHASHHLSFVLEGTGMVITGDAVGIHYPDFPVLIPTTPPPSFHLEQAIASIERILNLSPSRLLTPHFGIVVDPEKWLADNVRTLHQWRNELGNLTTKGYSLDETIEAFLGEVSDQAGRSVNDMPEHIRISIRLSVLGFTRFLKSRVS